MAGIVGTLKTIDDYKRADEEFQLRKQKAMQERQGTPPAALQLANEYQKRVAAGDQKGADLLAQFAKTVDRGVVTSPDGGYMSAPGYDTLLADRKGLTSTADEKAKQIQKTMYEPAREEDIATRKADVELRYAAPITTAKKAADINAAQVGDLQKKADSANVMGSLTDKARTILKEGDATGSILGATGAFGKRLVGTSDKSTRANAALDVIAGNLTSAVPRMEGPQSDADRAFYKEQAGKVNDKTLPLEDRLASLNAIDEINAKYAGINTPQKNALDNKVYPAEAAANKADAFAASKKRVESAFQLKKKGFTQEQIDEYLTTKGLQ